MWKYKSFLVSLGEKSIKIRLIEDEGEILWHRVQYVPLLRHLDSINLCFTDLRFSLPGVFCKTWGVTVPRSILGIDGSCIIVPCHFEVPKQEEANIQNCSDGGIWKKGNLLAPPIFSTRNPGAKTLQVGHRFLCFLQPETQNS